MSNVITESSKKSMKVRILTGFVMLLVGLPCVILGQFFILALALFLMVVSITEILKVNKNTQYPKSVIIATYVYSLSFFFTPFILTWGQGRDPFYFDVSQPLAFSQSLYYIINILLTILYLITLSLITFQNNDFKVNDMAFLLTFVTFITIGFLSMLYLRYLPCSSTFLKEKYRIEPFQYFSKNGWLSLMPTSVLFILIFFETALSDIGAYFAGVLFGKHPMNKEISPHKTWEGFIGGLVLAYIGYFGIAALFEFAFDMPMLPNGIQYALVENDLVIGLTILPLIVIGIIIPILGNVGGFMFSAVKRHFDVKDYGKIFPGHGGVIDRFDSNIMNFACIALTIALFVAI